jgi:hypothetical protein
VALTEQAPAESDSHTQGHWRERLEHERQSMRAALDWCVETADAPAAEVGLRLVATHFHRLFRGCLADGRQGLDCGSIWRSMSRPDYLALDQTCQ